jgi:predicted nucleic-acid-binding protein
MRAVDTHVLVRLATHDDPKQVVAAKAFVAGGAWVSQLVLMEMVWVLTSVYGLGHSGIITAIEILLSHQDLTIQDADVVKAAVEQFRRKPRIHFTDCLILEVARKAGHIPLGTFDHLLSQLPGTKQL